MNDIIIRICEKVFSTTPSSAMRCTVGHGNYVYIIQCVDEKYVIRYTEEKNSYKDTIYWLSKLNEIGIPVPQVISFGQLEFFDYLVLTYIEGRDIGIVYPNLCVEEKRQIAKAVVKIQNEVSQLEIKDIPETWSWSSFVEEMLDRAKERIVQNGYFDIEKVERLSSAKHELQKYFLKIQPIPYLDDISSKNLLIHNGKISGIIDVDWIGVGDKLTYVALTYVALLNLEYDTDYVDYILQEMKLSKTESKAYLFYSLMYCVDFMGERGTKFKDKVIEVNEQIIDRLNAIYGLLWDRWREI